MKEACRAPAWTSDKGDFNLGMGILLLRKARQWPAVLLWDKCYATSSRTSGLTAGRSLFLLGQTDVILHVVIWRETFDKISWIHQLSATFNHNRTLFHLCSWNINLTCKRMISTIFSYHRPPCSNLSPFETFPLCQAGKALAVLCPLCSSQLPWLELQTFRGCKDLLKPFLLSKSSGMQKLA